MVVVSEKVKALVQSSYTSWLQNNNYKPRKSQREMIAVIARFLSSIEKKTAENKENNKANVSLLEAGTGTGKTIAYMIPALCYGKIEEKKIVISTATVSLQEQLVNKDLPDLQKNTDLDFEYALAKGRQRYLCLNKLQHRLLDYSDSENKGTVLFPDEEAKISQSLMEEFKVLQSEFLSNSWDGDKDTLEDDIGVEDWSLIAADRSSCTGKQCDNYSRCALFKAREESREVDVLVVNHDLLLADLARGGGNVIADVENTIFIFDEAHHLPDKSRDHMSLRLDLAGEVRQIKQFNRIFERIKKITSETKVFIDIQKKVQLIDEALSQLLDVLGLNLQTLLQNAEADASGQSEYSDYEEYRFKGGKIHDDLRETFSELRECYKLKQLQLNELVEELSKLLKQKNGDKTLSLCEVLFASAKDALIRNETAMNICDVYAAKDLEDEAPTARWIRSSSTLNGDSIQIYAVPLGIGKDLQRILWQRSFACLLTSATLAPMGSFNHFLKKIGCDFETPTYKVLGHLNYLNAEFHIPLMKSNPSNQTEHTEELIQLMPTIIPEKAGTLVLFSSRYQMEQVYEGLKGKYEQEILVQGFGSKHYLLSKHKERIDNHQQSILFGLASFAEGVDLPGDYCVQVIIAKIPFAVPDNPVDITLGEWVVANGGNAFYDLALPEASIKLMQACGRLLRNERDQGRISLMDNRIINKSYGRHLLDALPPFRLNQESTVKL